METNKDNRTGMKSNPKEPSINIALPNQTIQNVSHKALLNLFAFKLCSNRSNRLFEVSLLAECALAYSNNIIYRTETFEPFESYMISFQAQGCSLR